MSLKSTINIRGEMMDLSQPKVMGIINVTPDSFYASSRKTILKDIMKSAEYMLSEGATFLDIGGYSSRPGAEDISEAEELQRVVEPIQSITRTFPQAIISIDTFRSEVASAAVDQGAQMVNDISAGHLDNAMLETVAQLKVPYVAMHMRGTPQTMKGMTEYDDIVKEMTLYFSKVISRCNDLGLKDVIIDPGFGFAKTAGQSFHVLNHLEYFGHLDKPVLAGVSRKSMIFKSLEITSAEALNGTTVLNTVALLKGAKILRVHDVREALETIKLLELLR